MSKTSKRRPCLISRKEETLRWQLVQGEITYREFYKAMCKLDPDKAKTLGTCHTGIHNKNEKFREGA